MHIYIYSTVQHRLQQYHLLTLSLMLKLSRVSENGNQHQLEDNYHLTPKRCQMQSCTLATGMPGLLHIGNSQRKTPI